MFLTNGGPLSAYPQYQKAEIIDGLLTVTNKRTAQLHRMNIGTITSDTSVLIKFAGGRSLGSVEEGFASKLKTSHRVSSPVVASSLSASISSLLQ